MSVKTTPSSHNLYLKLMIELLQLKYDKSHAELFARIVLQQIFDFFAFCALLYLHTSSDSQLFCYLSSTMWFSSLPQLHVRW